MNNNGGGNNFSGMSFGGMTSCKRAFFDKRSELHADHQEAMEELILSKRGRPAWGGGGGNRGRPGGGGDNRVRPGGGGGGGQPRGGGGNRGGGGRGGGGGGWSNITTSRVVRNNVTQNYNQGVVAGAGVVCKRETQELELERRELVAGLEALNDLGGIQKRSDSIHPTTEILATRDLGRMATALAINKRDLAEAHDQSAQQLARREAEEMLLQHARSLGFHL